MKNMKKSVGVILSIFLIICLGYIFFEPTISKAIGDTAEVSQEVTEEITIDAPLDTSLTPSIPGVTGNPGSPSTASLTWNVITSNATGFNMKIKASQANALFLDGTYFFSDYSPQTTNVPDYSWTSPGTATAEFGFTVEPATDGDVVQTFLDNASNACNIESGSQTAGKCWLNFNGATDINIINRSIRTTQTGEDETVKFRADSKTKFLKEGNYKATITTTISSN